MIDTSDDAIEADLERAARGGPAAATWIAWAQIRASLRQHAAEPPAEAPGRPAFLALPAKDGPVDIEIAVGPFGDSYAVPTAATQADRITAAARMLQVPREALDFVFRMDARPERHVALDLVPPAEPDFELDLGDGFDDEHDGTQLEHLEREDSMDADFFAEARKEHKK